MDVRIEFLQKHLTFTGEDSPTATLMLFVIGAVPEFERAFIWERQREGIEPTKTHGVHRESQKRPLAAKLPSYDDAENLGRKRPLFHENSGSAVTPCIGTCEPVNC